MDWQILPQAEGMVNNSLIVTAAAAHTHGWNFVMASTLSSVQTGIIQACAKTLRGTLTGSRPIAKNTSKTERQTEELGDG
jgi:hypothetical protein